MFKKKNCKKCGEKTNSKYRFCPNCGVNLNNSKNEDWGMLGKNDKVEENFMPPFLGGGMLNKMIGSAMKMLEKELQKDMKRTNQPNTNNSIKPNSNFRLMINGKEVPLNQQPQKQNKIEKKEIKKLPMFSDEKRKQFQKLEKKEPKIKIKRLADRLVCEIEIPEIKSIEDISILKLENSIEIKAIGKNKSYFKILQINSPIISYGIEKNNLILELESH
jgi:hypothetical protein